MPPNARKPALIGAALAGLAAILVVFVALSGSDSGSTFERPRVLSVSTACGAGPAVEVRVATRGARTVAVSTRLRRAGRTIAAGRRSVTPTAARITVRVDLRPASTDLLPYCRLVEGTSLRVVALGRRGSKSVKSVRSVPGDRYRAEVGRGIELGSVGSPVSEASGLAESRRSPGTFYTHDDSGGEPELYVLADDASIRAVQPLAGVVNDDWEDIALGPGRAGGSIYVADTGDNGQSRESVLVHRIPEPVLDGVAVGTELAPVIPETVELVYPEGARDSEALVVDPKSGDLYLITKRDARSEVYRAPAPAFDGEVVELERLPDLDLAGAVAADACPDGQTVLVKTYFGVQAFVSPEGVEAALAGRSAGRYYPGNPSFPQDESVATDPWCTGYSVLPEGEGAPLTRYAP